ncbi:MAG: hypothetical protein M0037_10675 [Betaproteobacteria bacterium]|nr:hypothetical protein [Betaproteobacteria bacterium]
MDLLVNSFLWSVLLSPAWVIGILLLTWRKLVVHRVRFFLASAGILLIALLVAVLGAYIVAAIGSRYVYFSGPTCKPLFVCAAFVFLSNNEGVVLFFTYALFLIGFVAVVKSRKPKWLGFCTNAPTDAN